jgi:hypothetical protein
MPALTGLQTYQGRSNCIAVTPKQSKAIRSNSILSARKNYPPKTFKNSKNIGKSNKLNLENHPNELQKSPQFKPHQACAPALRCFNGKANIMNAIEYNAPASWIAAATTPLWNIRTDHFKNLQPLTSCRAKASGRRRVNLQRLGPVAHGAVIASRSLSIQVNPWLMIGFYTKSRRVSRSSSTSLKSNKGKSAQKISDFFPATLIQNHWEILQKPPKKPCEITQKPRRF